MEKKKLDELFREGLSNPEVSYDEMHWKAMEEKLVRKSRKRATLVWFSSLSAAAAAIILVFLIFQPPVNQNAGTKAIVNKEAADARRKQTEETVPLNVQRTPKSAQRKPERKRLAIERREGEVGDKDERKEQIVDQLYRAPILAQTEFSGIFTPMNGRIGLGPIALTGISEIEGKSAIERKSNSSYLTILAAPDLTSVQGAGDPQLSRNIGLLYTLPLSNKLSISGGILYAKKYYNAPYSFYNPKNARDYGATPSEVEALCDVLDVPIELSYQVYRKGATRVSVNSGVSSYFMLREQYEFSYQTGDSHYAKPSSTYEIRGQNNHPFGVANLSATVEQQLNSNVVIGVRPFVKLPLTGVGYGRTKLESKGLAVSVSFKLGK